VPKEGQFPGLAERLRLSAHLFPVLALIVVVLGSIYMGVFTATEAAVLGVFGALVLAALQGSLSRRTFIDSLMGATRTSCMIALILAGSSFLSLSMGFTGLPRELAGWIASLELSPLTLILALTVFYIILGCFLDGISAVVLTMAVVEPMVRQAGIDLIWFGIFLVVVVEMAQITPPIGFNLFVLQGMTEHSIAYVARAAIPFFCLMVGAVGLIIAFPEIATYLPERMAERP
jgi:tripartite ATP-independent transporter DctM subunit